ncbi:MAG: topoisomerase [Thermoplasmata archaeon]|nr:MAG: topoisomerase [Thermoplasmata archaeon]
MNYKKSLEYLEKTLSELQEENKQTPIIVEGDKDIDALRRLEIKGVIITINTGVSIIDFCDKVASECRRVIILTDWDRKGGFLCYMIKKNLEGRVSCDTRFREVFAKYSMIRTVEGLPSWIETLKAKVRN